MQRGCSGISGARIWVLEWNSILARKVQARTGVSGGTFLEWLRATLLIVPNPMPTSAEIARQERPLARSAAILSTFTSRLWSAQRFATGSRSGKYQSVPARGPAPARTPRCCRRCRNQAPRAWGRVRNRGRYCSPPQRLDSMAGFGRLPHSLAFAGGHSCHPDVSLAEALPNNEAGGVR